MVNAWGGGGGKVWQGGANAPSCPLPPQCTPAEMEPGHRLIACPSSPTTLSLIEDAIVDSNEVMNKIPFLYIALCLLCTDEGSQKCTMLLVVH